MCGRYFIDDEMWREIRKICKQIDAAKLKVTVGDVRPTDMAMVLTGMKNVHLEAMRWGFTSKYQDWLLINARAESILSKPAFRNSVRNCRCVIPAAGFYEWNKEKEKISFTMPQSDILYMAGVWQPTEKESQFTIITTVPNSSVSSVHDRMPLVLTPEEIQPWIQDWSTAERLLTKTPPLLEQRQEFEQCPGTFENVTVLKEVRPGQCIALARTNSIMGRRSSSFMPGISSISGDGIASSTACSVKPLCSNPIKICVKVWCCFTTS